MWLAKPVGECWGAVVGMVGAQQWHSGDAVAGSVMGTEVGIAGTAWARVCMVMARWGRGGGDGEGIGGTQWWGRAAPFPVRWWGCGA